MNSIETTAAKKRILSGIKPTGQLTIGNYLGAIKNWTDMQDEYDCYYFVADLHSITIDIEPQVLRRQITETFAILLASGLGKKSVLFVQSHIPAHAELGWILNCYTYFGEAKRMTQFKDKSAKHPDNVNVGLFDYPVLQAADILLYQADMIPIGIDQKQHVEITRTIAERFNSRYSPTFTVPEPIMPKVGAKIMSLCDPLHKMSKSDDNENSYILILDKPEDILRKLKRAVTDSDAKVRFDVKNKAGISNLITIYSAFSGKSIAETEKEFANANYGAFKNAVAECVIEGLRPVQAEFNKLIKDKDYLNQFMIEGMEKASRIANKTLAKVYRKIGFVRPE